MLLVIDSTSVWNSIGGMRPHSSTRKSCCNLVFCWWGWKTLSQAPFQNLPLVFSCVEIWWLRWPWHMVHIVFMFIKPFSDHWYPVNGGIAILHGHSHGRQNNGQLGLPSIFIHDPKHDGMWIAQEPHLCGSACFQNTLYPSFTRVFPLF
jgi:hypothetical protein